MAIDKFAATPVSVAIGALDVMTAEAESALVAKIGAARGQTAVPIKATVAMGTLLITTRPVSGVTIVTVGESYRRRGCAR
jgi:hypothetical protein